MIRHRYEAWNAALIPGSKQAKARAAAAAAARRRAAAAAAARAPTGPPRPPGTDFISRVFPEYAERSEPEWEKLLNARVKPYETAVQKVRTQELGQSEFAKEQAEAANERLGLGFANLFTGGKAGAEGQQFAKENFGGELIGMQAVSIAATHLAEITSDWNERDWEISSQYQKAMAEVPGLKEQMRESITRNDTDEYTRKFNIANLLLDEAWNVYNANAKQYNTEQQLLAAKKMAAQQAGLTGWPDRKDALNEATKYTDDTGVIYKVRRAKDGSWEAYPTNQKKPVTGGAAGTEIKWRNAALREAADLTKATGRVHKAQKVGGVWTAVDTGKKSATAKSGKNAKPETVQAAEAALIKELYEDKEKYAGTRKPNKNRRRTKKNGKWVAPPAYVQEGGMTYDEAYQQFFDYALSVLSPFGRTNTYVSNWVRQRLANLYPGESPARDVKPGGG